MNSAVSTSFNLKKAASSNTIKVALSPRTPDDAATALILLPFFNVNLVLDLSRYCGGTFLSLKSFSSNSDGSKPSIKFGLYCSINSDISFRTFIAFLDKLHIMIISSGFCSGANTIL